MFRRFLSALMVLLLCGGIDAAAQEAAADHGVLLGLRTLEPIPKPLPYYATTQDSAARSVYQTLLVVRNDTTFRVTAAPDELIIPRTNRLWRAGVKRSIYNNWIEDFVWAAPTGALPEWSGIQPYNGEYCEGHRVQDVLYAGPSYLALEQRSSGYCEGAAHPWLFNTLAVVPIDSVTHTGLAIGQVLGEQAEASLDEAATDYLTRLRDPKRRARFSDEADPANWALRHQQGRWVVLARLDGIDETAQDLMVDLPLALDLPASLLGRRPTAMPWAEIQDLFPDAVDAVVAPDQSWVLIVHPRRLTAHVIRDGTIGPARLVQRLPFGATVVMDRWATGEQLRQWQQRLRLTNDAES